MTADDRMGCGIVGTVAVFAVGMAAKGHVAWGGDFRGAGIAALLLAAGFAALLVAARVGARRTVRGAMTAKVHAHEGRATGRQRLIGRHEVGHVAGAEATGMGVESVKIGDGWGYVQAKRFTTVDDAITFLAAGHLAVHTKSGADGDLANIRRLAKLLPPEERARRLSTATRKARTIVASQSGRIRRDGHRLADSGRW